MNPVIGLIAASLLGADGSNNPPAPMISYQIQFLEMNGLDWRATIYPQLQPVARQGNATVWTTSREVASNLAEKAGRVLGSPKVSALPENKATVFQNSTRKVVTDMTREADGPINHASFVGYVPKLEDASEGYSATVSGRKIDQGVLAKVALQDRQITAVHPVSLSEVQEPGQTKPGLVGDAKRWNELKVTIQVPEVAHTDVAGEWLIPTDGVLLVSLGAHTVADAQGKAVVRERLAVVEAKQVDGNAPAFSAGPVRVTLRNLAREPALAIPLPAPTVPSRSLPQPLNTSGKPLALPPLPDELSPLTSLPGSAEPCATPQSRGVPLGDPVPSASLKNILRDLASRRASFDSDLECCASSEEKPDAKASLETRWAPVQEGKPFSFRVPINGNIMIEVRAVAAPSAPAPASKSVTKPCGDTKDD